MGDGEICRVISEAMENKFRCLPYTLRNKKGHVVNLEMAVKFKMSACLVFSTVALWLNMV